MKRLLPKAFFNRDVHAVARELLGMYLVAEQGKEKRSLRITETESYDGEDDLACHASKGRTKRTEVLYGNPGHFYVYLCYGMHYLLNLVARERGYPAGVLIRGGITEEGKRIEGPGRVSKYLGIDGMLHGKKVGKDTGVWVEDRGMSFEAKSVRRTPRIGVEYAGSVWSQKKYRFLVK